MDTKKHIKLRVSCFTILFAGVAVTGCLKHEENANLTTNITGSVAKPVSAPKSDLIKIDMGAEIPTVDPQMIEDNNSARVDTDLFAGVVTLDQSNIPVAELAKYWDISKDGKTYTFHLRDGIKFSDGSPITANDVVFSWQRLVDPKTGSPYTYIANSIVNADKVTNKQATVDQLGSKALDDHTVRLTLLYPDSDILAKLATSSFAVISKDEVLKYGKQWTDPKNILTSGAYLMKEHVINGCLLLEKNPYYYNADNVKINQVKFFPFVDTNTALAKYKSDALEITWSVPVDQFKQINNDYKDQLHVTPLEGVMFYDLNMLNPTFKDIRLRKALNLAVDRVTITKDVLGTGVTPNYSIITTSIDGGKYISVTYPWVNDARSKQVADAKQLYKEAGYGPNKQLKLTILYSTGDDEKKKVALSIASMWKDVLGVNVTVQNVDWKTFLQALQNGDYQVAADRWVADYNGVSTYTHMYLCNAPENTAKYCNPEYDKYINQAVNSTNAKTRQDLYIKALNIAQNDYATIPLYQPSSRRLIKPYVKGFTPETNHLDKPATKWIEKIRTRTSSCRPHPPTHC
ncbi:MAG: peptide ABC transporter substrate-binding protein, partial [Burkholderiales bacterium]|nr:peptide ABC transporter substrate-binding protein [Burkholderiales bacterium]